MCHKLSKTEVYKVFKIEEEGFHDLKEILIGQFKDDLKKKKLGDNPDLAWCGDPKSKALCFKHAYDKTKEFCTEKLINEL